MTIKEIRELTGLTQKQFAEKYHITFSSIRNWESGHRTCPDYVVELLEFRVRCDNMKRNNPSWCCDKIEEKIEDYKLSVKETTDENVRRQLEIIIEDLESILYD